MSDYIMNRESLKRHCEKTCEKFKDVPTSGTYGEHRLVLDLLEQTKWIPVSERLPEEDDFYLVTAKVGNELIIDISEYTPKTDFWDIPHEIVAWLPLPKPYKAESEE